MRSLILAFHKVGPEDEEGRFLNVSPEHLERLARFCARRSRIVTVAELHLSARSGQVAFSFDDAYVSAVQQAPAILERVGGRGSFYAVTERVGESSIWDGERARPLAGWDALREIAAAGHEVGNHSATHPRMGELTPEAAAQEWRAAHDRLLAEGLPPLTACYPFGSVNPAGLAELGYRIALALQKRPHRPDDDPLALPRIVVGYSGGVAAVLYKAFVRPLFKRS